MKGKIMFTEFIISALVSVMGIFLVPNVIEKYYVATSISGALTPIVLVLVCILAALTGTAFLGTQLNNKSFTTSLFRIWGFVCALLCLIVIFSILSGFFSVAVYKSLKMSLSLAQIKGIINYSVTAVTVLSFPFIVSVFWSILRGNEAFFKDLKAGFVMKNYRYVKVLGLLLSMFGIGILLNSLFNYISAVLLADILKVILLSSMGMGLMYYSERITDTRRI